MHFKLLKLHLFENMSLDSHPVVSHTELEMGAEDLLGKRERAWGL